MLKFEEIILFENDHYLAINKPYGYATLDERDQTKKGLLQIAKEIYGDIQVCHRLDKETSGVLLFAKNPASYRHASLQFENREVTKIYHAFVEGTAKLDNLLVDLPILPLKDGNVKIDKTGKEAATIFNTLEVFSKHSLIACLPITGRMHQIRIHLASIKRPILADKLYGGQDIFLSDIKRKFKLKKDTEEQPLISRVALHAYSLTFTDMEGNEIIVQAPYPKDMRALKRQLEIN
jgi:23S rRNA pseudouridine955/2504/2580 synthase